MLRYNTLPVFIICYMPADRQKDLPKLITELLDVF
jgi:hypothetical protein